MRNSGVNIVNYVDDCCGFSLPSQSADHFAKTKNTIEQLGLDISKKKLVPPSTKCTCLGIVFNTEDFSMSIPEEKLIKIKALCNSWQEKNTVY